MCTISVFGFDVFCSNLLFIYFFLPSCVSCQFLVLAFCFCFVCLLFQDCVVFFFRLFFCLLSCDVLNHHVKFVFALHLVLLVLFLLLFCFVVLVFFDFWLAITNISQHFGYCKTTDILTRAISTGVLTNRVCFPLCFFEFCIFAEKL